MKLSHEQLANRLIGIATDGAAVMIGQHRGLITSRRNTAAPWMDAIQCDAHRLNLSAGVLKRDELVTSITAVLDAAEAHFCKSPQRVNMLRNAAESVGQSYLVPMCWLCILPVIDRLLAVLPVLLAYSLDSPNADSLYTQLTSYTVITADKALLPLLRALNKSCLACQA
jgi:hypothetical protein